MAELQFTTFKDLENPWTFDALFLQNKHLVVALLLDTFWCPKCERTCNACVRTRNIDGQTFRCPVARHEYSIRKYIRFRTLTLRFPRNSSIFFAWINLKSNATFSGLDYKEPLVANSLSAYRSLKRGLKTPVISKFNSTLTPKGSYSAKTGVKLPYESKQSPLEKNVMVK